MLDNTDQQLAKILEAIKDVGVGKYGEYMATKMHLTLYTDSACMVIAAIAFGLLLPYALAGENDDGARIMTGIGAMIASVIFLVSLSSLPGDFASIKHPEGAVAQQILETLKSK